MSGDRKLNLISGGIVLGLVVAVVAWFGGGWLLKPAPEPGRRFVAMFDEAGGIKAGDAVRIEGRRAGIVTDVQLVHDDGRMRVRVEFEIRPGTSSKWLNTAQIPADARIEVAEAGMFGRPQLNIREGQSKTKFIEEGGEWTNTRGASTEDPVVQFRENVESFDKMLDQLDEFLAPGGDMDGIKSAVADLRVRVEDASNRTTQAMANAPEADRQLVLLKEDLEALGRRLAEADAGIAENLKALSQGGKSAEDAAAKMDEQLAEVLASTDRLRTAVADSGELLTAKQAEGLGTELRRFAARLRMSMEIAKADPSQAGDLPNWRLSRRYFNGQTPLPGGDPE